VSEERILRLDAVKIDVEGAEELVLRGARTVLRNVRPILVFEMIPGNAERLGLAQDGAWKVLAEEGYSCYELDEHGHPLAIATFDERRHVRGGNFIAVHADRVADVIGRGEEAP
jgi:hypothetical protein